MQEAIGFQVLESFMENAHAAASKHEVPTKDSKNMDATVTTTSGVCVVQICPVVGRLHKRHLQHCKTLTSFTLTSVN